LQIIDLYELDIGILERVDSSEVHRKHQDLLEDLLEFDYAHYEQWCIVDSNVLDKLHQPLLVKIGKGKLSVNFHPLLTRLLREARYLQELKLEIPSVVMEILNRVRAVPFNEILIIQGPDLFDYVQRLEFVVRNFNHIHATMLSVEVPLFAERLSDIDRLLEKVFGLRFLVMML